MHDKDGNFVDWRELLKVKIKSLAAESRIIRQEERKNKNAYFMLHSHRIGIVRKAARTAQWAYAIIRGKGIGQIESTRRPEALWIVQARLREVEKLLKKYGSSGGAEIPSDYLELALPDKERKAA